jgi:hypothetical protein
MARDKKQQEREVLDAFRKHYDDFPKGKIRASESPDFIIIASRKNSIGVELTKIVRLSGDDFNIMESLHSLLEKKEEKFRLYQQKVLNEYWLILYFYLDKKELNQSVINKLTASKSWFSFNRLFLFNLLNQSIYEI